MRLAYAVCLAVHWCCVQCSRYAASRLEIALVFDTSQPFADHEVGLNTRGASTRACALFEAQCVFTLASVLPVSQAARDQSKNHGLVCVDYTKKLCYATHAGGDR